MRRLVTLALRRDHGPPPSSIPAHGRLGGREAFDVKRKRRLTMIMAGLMSNARKINLEKAAKFVSSKMAISELPGAGQSYVAG